jgi:hypothetical protein
MEKPDFGTTDSRCSLSQSRLELQKFAGMTRLQFAAVTYLKRKALLLQSVTDLFWTDL